MYAASKSCLVTFSQVLAAEVLVGGVRVEVVCPGVVGSEFHSRQGIDIEFAPVKTSDDDDGGNSGSAADHLRGHWSALSSLLHPSGRTGGMYEFMRGVLASERGKDLYRRRQGLIEPLFANTKFNRKIYRFHRRGRSAVRSEWRLINATHNLLRLHNHRIAAQTA
jgi:hypothetical protein